MRRTALAGLAAAALAVPAFGQGTAVVYGAVTDSGGAPLPQALVTIVQPARRAFTDAAGRYRFDGLPAGNVTVRAALIGFAADSAPVALADGDSARADLVLRAAQIELNPVIVTAAKRSQFLDEAVTSVAVVDEERLAARAVNTVDEAIDRAPGVQILNGQINIRGSTGYMQGLGARVLLLVDGVPVNQGDRGGINWDILHVDQVERVEIVKGAGSALYGSTALGGVVNLITREIPSGFHLRARATGGAFGDPPHPEWAFRDETGLQGGLDVTASYGAGPFRGSLAAGARHSDGYREQDERDHWQVAGRGAWRFAGYGDLDVAAAWAVDDYQVPLIWCERGQCDDGGQARQPFKIAASARGARTVSRKGYLTGTWSRVVSPRLRWQARGSWIRTDFVDHRDSGDSVDFSEANRLGVELRGEVHPSQQRVVTVGLEGSRSDSWSNIFSGDSARTARSRTQGEYAAYGESEQPLGPVRVTLGARTDFLAVDGGAITAVVSPRAGAVLPTGAGVWRASAGRGFRAPSLAERFVRTSALGFDVVPNPNLDPETSWSFELGNTISVSPDLRLDAAAFWTEARRLIEPVVVIEFDVDPVTGDSTPVPRIQFQNVSRARLAGVDLAATASPFVPRLTTSLAYTWLHARELARDTLPERSLAFRPRHLVTASAEYDLAPFGVGADFRYMSRLDRVEIYDDDPRVSVRVLDLRASYRRGPIQANLLVANALNYIYNLVPRTLAPVRTVTATVAWTY